MKITKTIYVVRDEIVIPYLNDMSRDKFIQLLRHALNISIEILPNRHYLVGAYQIYTPLQFDINFCENFINHLNDLGVMIIFEKIIGRKVNNLTNDAGIIVFEYDPMNWLAI